MTLNFWKRLSIDSSENRGRDERDLGMLEPDLIIGLLKREDYTLYMLLSQRTD